MARAGLSVYERARARQDIAEGLTTMDDFKGHWDKKAKEREAFYSGKHDREARREAVMRAMEKHRG